MLELKNITKEYITGAETVQALKGVSLAFRNSEFVSILGPSGCGKTTLLNIMGGLDQYTSGDLVINGISTREYKDADWDAYRNHSIGFVFQSYNLIPHQTVLANVELALTLSGVSEEERHRRAVAALEEVGLGDQMNKRPAQMSGGQMQRVAIARALINNPDILLADEPTGALDSETSVQIMDIIRNIARDRLVIMVTHNPELAKQYSTRIVSLQDGRVIGDSNPFNPTSESVLGADRIKNKSMSMKTALKLSLNNLMTKKARTLLTAFAGSIGIIGIALILSVSNGFQHYIDQMENDTLTSYPLTIQSETADMTSMVTAFATAAQDIKAQEGDHVKEQQLMSQMFASVGSNDLKTFNNHVHDNMGEEAELAGCFDAIQYSFGIQPQIYSTSYKYGVLQICPNNFMGQYMNSMQQTAMSFSNMDVFSELIDNDDINKELYKVVAGKWPEKYDELVLILQDENTMTDFMSYSLGLRDPDEMNDMISELMNGESVDFDDSPLEWSYDELLSMEFSLVPASSRYQYNRSYDVWEDMSDDEAFMKNLIENGEKLKITAIAVPNPDNTSGMTGYGVGYLPELTRHVIDVASESDIVKHQKAQQKKDVFSGKTFEDLRNDTDEGLGFGDMISIDKNKLANALGAGGADSIKDDFTDLSDALGNLDPTDYVQDIIQDFSTQAGAALGEILSQHVTPDPETGGLIVNTDEVQSVILSRSGTSAHKDFVNSKLINKFAPYAESYFADNNPIPMDRVADLAAALIGNFLGGENQTDAIGAYTAALAIQQTAQEAPKAVANLANDMANSFKVDPEGIASAFSMNMSEEELTRLIMSYMSSGSDASYEANLRSLGYADTSNPYAISYYLTNFDSKEKFMKFIDTYNDDMEEQGKDELVISYTDVTGVLLSSVKKITNAVSYVLIAFVAISLIVSSIMIGVITYISVLERTKEIGILRAIGAAKRDISRIFNAETIIIGLCAGVIGIGVSLLLLIPINAILIKLTDIAALKAILPTSGAVILIIISMVLTLIAGLLPSGMAAKKDPVEALRTE